MSKEESHVDLLYPSKYLRQADLLGRDVTVTIASIKREELVMRGGAKEMRVVMTLVGTDKKFVVGATNRDTIKTLHGKYVDDWTGKRITLYVDPTVRRGGEVTGGIRVRPKVPPPASKRSERVSTDGPPDDPEDDIPDFSEANR